MKGLEDLGSAVCWGQLFILLQIWEVFPIAHPAVLHFLIAAVWCKSTASFFVAKWLKSFSVCSFSLQSLLSLFLCADRRVTHDKIVDHRKRRS